MLAALCGAAGFAQAPQRVAQTVAQSMAQPMAPTDTVRDANGPVFLVRMVGAIGPASADQFSRAIERASRQHAQLVVLQLDTPGGLDTAMRGIIKDILAAPMPVVGFVSPQGARAASAGTYILYATHVAAMAPATNLGAATPIALGMPSPAGGAPPVGTQPAEPVPSDSPSGRAAASETKSADGRSAGSQGPGAQPVGPVARPQPARDTSTLKHVNDAAAYIRSLAQLRERDVAWAELAVRDAVSLSASDALSRKVIDLIASDVDDLLRQLDGRVVRLGEARAASIRLHTAGADRQTLEPDWRDRLLAAISDPSLALILLMIGAYGLLFEFMNPGFFAPGVIGALCLLLALWGLHMLPINYAGLALIALGIAFFTAEAYVPSYGALGIGGVASFAFGALLLIDSDLPDFRIAVPLIAVLALVSGIAVFGIAAMAARARRRPVVSGTPHLLEATGEVIEFADGEGWALVDGERWRVAAAQSLWPGQRVRIMRVEGLLLRVSPIPEPHAAQPVMP